MSNIMSTDDFREINENEEESSFSGRVRKPLSFDRFYASLTFIKRVEYYMYKKLSALLPQASLTLLVLIMAAIAYGIEFELVLTIVNFILLIVNLLFVAGKKIQEEKDEKDREDNLLLDYKQAQTDKKILEKLDEIIEKLSEHEEEDITKF